MKLTRIFSFYPILYLLTGNNSRLLFLPILIINLVDQFFKNKIKITNKLLVTSSIFIIYSIILSLINNASLKFLLLQIIQILIFIFFSGCSKDLAIQYSKELKKTSFLIIGIVLIVICFKITGFDVSQFNYITRFQELKYELNREIQLPGAISTIENQIKNNISIGNPTHMNSVLFLIMLLPHSNISSLNYSFFLLPLSFFSGSRTYFISILMIFISKLFNFRVYFLRNKFIFYSFFPLLILIITFLFSKNFNYIIDNMLAHFGFNKSFSSFLLDESRRLSFYKETIGIIKDFIFIGGGPGYSYKFFENLYSTQISTESLYITLIIDYGLLSTIFIISYFTITFIKSRVLSKLEILLILLTGLFISYESNDLIYILLGLGVNKNIHPKEDK